MKWYDITPQDAVDIDCTKRPDLDPPRNEEDEVCPWPWEPQQLVGAPLGQFHCSYCGAMCMAGLRHPDYTGVWEEYEALMRAEAERDYRLHMHATLYGNRPAKPAGDELFPEAPW